MYGMALLYGVVQYVWHGIAVGVVAL
jgi:hypothetical protein